MLMAIASILMTVACWRKRRKREKDDMELTKVQKTGGLGDEDHVWSV